MKKFLSTYLVVFMAFSGIVSVTPPVFAFQSSQPAEVRSQDPPSPKPNYSLKGKRPVPNLFYDGKRVLNLMFAPVDPTRKIDWTTECMRTLQDWNLETVQYRDKAGVLREAKGWLSPGTALIYRKDGTGIPWVHACGNPVPSLIGREMPFGKDECAPQAEVRTQTIEVPGPERVVYEPAPRELYVPPPSDNRWFCAEGGWRTGLCVILALATGYGIHEATRDKGEDCKDCCPTCPGRTKPDSLAPASSVQSANGLRVNLRKHPQLIFRFNF